MEKLRHLFQLGKNLSVLDFDEGFQDHAKYEAIKAEAFDLSADSAQTAWTWNVYKLINIRRIFEVRSMLQFQFF